MGDNGLVLCGLLKSCVVNASSIIAFPRNTSLYGVTAGSSTTSVEGRWGLRSEHVHRYICTLNV